jgi:hypothetical protein
MAEHVPMLTRSVLIPKNPLKAGKSGSLHSQGASMMTIPYAPLKENTDAAYILFFHEPCTNTERRENQTSISGVV